MSLASCLMPAGSSMWSSSCHRGPFDPVVRSGAVSVSRGRSATRNPSPAGAPGRHGSAAARRRISSGMAGVAPEEWTCPVHPEVVQPEPGVCPICGLPLEPRTMTARAPTATWTLTSKSE
jgi:Cu+-exporting ATPase